MPTTRLVCLGLLSMIGCQHPLEPLEPSADGDKCPAPPDLTPPAAPCAAAKGLGGDILGGLCLDMDKIDPRASALSCRAQSAG